MKRIRLLGLALIAVFALGAMASASAFAEVEIKPNGSKAEPIKFTGLNNGNTTLETTAGTKVTCEVAKASGEFLTANSGFVLIDFEKCKSSGLNCNSLGDKTGIILTLLPMQLVDVLPTGTLDLGIWLEPKLEGSTTTDLDFICGEILVVTVLGSVIGVADNSAGALLTSGTKGKEFKVLWKQTTGEQEIKECDFPVAFCEEGGKKKKFLLLSKLGSGTEELSGQLADATLTFTKEVEFIF